MGKQGTNGQPELLARVINLYLVESPKLIPKLKQAADANVVAGVLSRYCEDIEAEHGRVQAALAAEFETLAPSKA